MKFGEFPINWENMCLLRRRRRPPGYIKAPSSINRFILLKYEYSCTCEIDWWAIFRRIKRKYYIIGNLKIDTAYHVLSDWSSKKIMAGTARGLTLLTPLNYDFKTHRTCFPNRGILIRRHTAVGTRVLQDGLYMVAGNNHLWFRSMISGSLWPGSIHRNRLFTDDENRMVYFFVSCYLG